MKKVMSPLPALAVVGLACCPAAGCVTYHPEYDPVTSYAMTQDVSLHPVEDTAPATPSGAAPGCARTDAIVGTDATLCVRLGRDFEKGANGRPIDVHRARWYYSEACGHGDAAACDDAQRLIALESELPPTEAASASPSPSMPPGPGGLTVYGGINVYGGNVTFGPITTIVGGAGH